VHVCERVQEYVCVCVCLYVFACMCVFVCVRVSVYMYVFMYACRYTQRDLILFNTRADFKSAC